MSGSGQADNPARRAGWNVVATLAEPTFREAVRLLGRWGKVRRTHFYNVLALQVDDPDAFLIAFAQALDAEPGLRNIVSHVVPAQQNFDFATAEEFESRAREIVLGWAPRLAGVRFHVRMHRRGFGGALSSQPEEQALDAALLAALSAAGAPGRIDFDDPDYVIQIETIDGRAGVSLWSREALRRYPFLGVD